MNHIDILAIYCYKIYIYPKRLIFFINTIFILILITGCGSDPFIDESKKKSPELFIALTNYYSNYDQYPESIEALKPLYLDERFSLNSDSTHDFMYFPDEEYQAVFLVLRTYHYECRYRLAAGRYNPDKVWSCADTEF